MEDRDDGPASGPVESKRERRAAKSFSGVAPHLSACAIEAWRGPLEHVLGAAPTTGPDLDDMFDELLGLLSGDLPIEMFGTRFGTKLDARGGTLTRAATLAQSTIRIQRDEIDRLRAALQKSETLAERRGVELATMLDRTRMEEANGIKTSGEVVMYMGGMPLKLRLRGDTIVPDDTTRRAIGDALQDGRANAAALERIKEIAEAPFGARQMLGVERAPQAATEAFEAVAEIGLAYGREIAISNSIASHNATLMFSLAGIGVGEEEQGEAGIEIERPGKALYTDERRNRVEVLGPGGHDRTVILSIEREHDDEDSARVAEIPIDAFLRIMEQGITTRSQDS